MTGLFRFGLLRDELSAQAKEDSLVEVDCWDCCCWVDMMIGECWNESVEASGIGDSGEVEASE